MALDEDLYQLPKLEVLMQSLNSLTSQRKNGYPFGEPIIERLNKEFVRKTKLMEIVFGEMLVIVAWYLFH